MLKLKEMKHRNLEWFDNVILFQSIVNPYQGTIFQIGENKGTDISFF